MADVARTELLHRVAVLPPGTPPAFRALAAVGRRFLADRYVHLSGRHHDLRPTLARWRFVRAAARLSEPLPAEHPALLALLDRAAGGLAR